MKVVNREKKRISEARFREKRRRTRPEWRTFINNYLARRKMSRRRKLIEMLGGKCVKCGFNSDWRAFQIDHIKGGGCQERKRLRTIDAYYKDIEKEGGRKYQLLCANCNQIKQYDRKEHSPGNLKNFKKEVSR